MSTVTLSPVFKGGNVPSRLSRGKRDLGGRGANLLPAGRRVGQLPRRVVPPGEDRSRQGERQRVIRPTRNFLMFVYNSVAQCRNIAKPLLAHKLVQGPDAKREIVQVSSESSIPAQRSRQPKEQRSWRVAADPKCPPVPPAPCPRRPTTKPRFSCSAGDGGGHSSCACCPESRGSRKRLRPPGRVGPLPIGQGRDRPTATSDGGSFCWRRGQT